MWAGGIRGAALASAVIGASTGAAGAIDGSSPSGGRYRAMIDRPLFSPTRRPPPPAPAPLDSPVMPDLPPPRPDLSLSGIIAGGGGGVALLRRPQDGSPLRLALGGKVDGWTLAEIRPRAVVLRRDGRDVTVDLPAP